MKSLALGIVAAAFAGGVAIAQTTTSAPSPSGMATTPAPSSQMNVAPMNHDNQTRSGVAAASGDDNQAVATTSANAATPAHGRNSFTSGEARRRLQAHGFSNVSALKKDQSGVWRGMAQKDGQPVRVWLDYKGSVGQQQ